MSEHTPATQKPRWPWYAGGIVILAFILYVLVAIFVPGSEVSTSDAQISAHYATIAPREAGQVASVAVKDNQMVHKGQLLASLDDRDYKNAVAQAEAQLAQDDAQAASAKASIARQPEVIAEAGAEVRQADASLKLAQQNATRYDNLAKQGATSRQSQQEAAATLHEQQAALDAARATMRAATRQQDVLQQTLAQAEATVASDKAALAQAKLNLSYTRIVAPFDGMVGQRSAESGDYVSAGTAMMVLVPTAKTYVEANYREVALRHVRPGQPVRIHVDAYDVELNGVVDSVPPATGAEFAPIGPENATGNFTKIVQRLPVKIVFLPGQPGLKQLRLGMSVETHIDTDAPAKPQKQG